MSKSLKDQLLGLGFKTAPAAPKPAAKPFIKNNAVKQESTAKPAKVISPAPVLPIPNTTHQTENRNDRPNRGRHNIYTNRRNFNSQNNNSQNQHSQNNKFIPSNVNSGGDNSQQNSIANQKTISNPNTISNQNNISKKNAENQDEINLAKAYSLRKQQDILDKENAEREQQERARQKREARQKLNDLFKDKSLILNVADAEIARNFLYGEKIKRIYVTSEQLKALNAGELGVAQIKGHYYLVAAAVLAQVEALLPSCVALKVDPNAPAVEEDYSDPRYQVPDDLVW